MFGTVIDISPKFYTVPSIHRLFDLRVKIMDLEFLC